ncbi:hypothetical protein F4703DRAFT_1409496 [Phycomyces blakesleeanus]
MCSKDVLSQIADLQSFIDDFDMHESLSAAAFARHTLQASEKTLIEPNGSALLDTVELRFSHDLSSLMDQFKLTDEKTQVEPSVPPPIKQNPIVEKNHKPVQRIRQMQRPAVVHRPPVVHQPSVIQRPPEASTPRSSRNIQRHSGKKIMKGTISKTEIPELLCTPQIALTPQMATKAGDGPNNDPEPVITPHLFGEHSSTFTLSHSTSKIAVENWSAPRSSTKARHRRLSGSSRHSSRSTKSVRRHIESVSKTTVPEYHPRSYAEMMRIPNVYERIVFYEKTFDLCMQANSALSAWSTRVRQQGIPIAMRQGK